MSFTEMKIILNAQSNESTILIIIQQDNFDRPLPPPNFCNPNTMRGRSFGSMSALYANSPNIDPRVRL